LRAVPFGLRSTFDPSPTNHANFDLIKPRDTRTTRKSIQPNFGTSAFHVFSVFRGYLLEAFAFIRVIRGQFRSVSAHPPFSFRG
jgi:hypothetical protein